MFKQHGCLFCVMAQDATAALKAKIRELSDELELLGSGPDHVPEFTIRANMLRQNDYLERSNRIREDIISTYADYSGILEDALRSLFQVQRELVEIMHQQVSSSRSRPR